MSEEPQQHDTHPALPALDVLRASLPDAAQRERFDRFMAILETPDAAHGREPRIEATLGVVATARDADRSARLGTQSPLSPDDAARVDHWVEGHADDRLSGLVTLLDLPQDESREERISSTLAMVQNEVDRQSERLRLDPVADEIQSRRRFSLSDFGAIAAGLVLIAAITFPMLSNFQANTWATQSTANLQAAGLGASLFAADHQERVPHVAATSSRVSSQNQWWLVGDASQSHSANLFALINGAYVPLESLNAPGNDKAPHSLAETAGADWANQDQVSYSYRLFDRSAPPSIIDLNRSILISDRSPVVRQALEQGTFNASQNSYNRRGKGQHIALGDTSVAFLTSPILPNGDNIWLPQRAEISGTLSLRGDELPASPDDQFLGP